MTSPSDKSLSTHLHHLANQVDLVATVIMEQRTDWTYRQMANEFLRLGEGLRQVADHLVPTEKR